MWRMQSVTHFAPLDALFVRILSRLVRAVNRVSVFSIAILCHLVRAVNLGSAFSIAGLTISIVRSIEVLGQRTDVGIDSLTNVLEPWTNPVLPLRSRRWVPLRAPPAQMSEEVADAQADAQRELERLRQLNGITAETPQSAASIGSWRAGVTSGQTLS